jgi:hypothetical protein
MVPRVKSWVVRYYDASDVYLRGEIVRAPTKTLARMAAPSLLAVPHAVRRTVTRKSTR